MLWREHDWRPALVRLATQLAGQPDSPAAQRAAVELGRAYEYIEPDRRCAIDAYELASGAAGRRAHDLAVELAWWPARARLLVALRVTDPNPRLALDEAEAWWDAGQRELCALALAGVRSPDSARVDDLAELLAGDHLMDHGAAAAVSAAKLTGTDAADRYVMAARFAHAADDRAATTRWLEAAIVARPGHRVASAHLLVLALASREPKPIQAYMRARLERLDPTSWLDAVRASAFAMIDSPAHRGFGLRLLRRALERAYESAIAQIPGHLAMWTVLAAHADADATRRDLMPLVISGLNVVTEPVDRVWLAALATEISLRDSGSPIIAGAYAEMIAEHAPDHPIVRELVAAIAGEDPGDPIPAAAVAAATAQLAQAVTIDHAGELSNAYADATHAAIIAVAPLPAAEPTAVPQTEPTAVEPTAIVATPVAAAESRPALPVAAAEPIVTRPVAAAAVPVAAAEPIVTRPVAAAEPRIAPLPITAAEPIVTRPVAAAEPRPALMPITAAEPIAAAEPRSATPAAKLASPIAIGATAAESRDVETRPLTVKIPTVLRDAQPVEPRPAPPPIPTSRAVSRQIAIPAVIGKPSVAKKPAPASSAVTAPAIARTPAPPPLPSRTSRRPTDPRQMFDALRTPDRPPIASRPPDPPDASPRARRTSVPIDIRLVLDDGTRITGHSRDVSTSGLFVLAADIWAPIGTELYVELLLPGKEAFVEDEFRARARIARRDDDGVGIELLDPEPALLVALAAL